MIGYYGDGVRAFACIFILGLIILVVLGIIAIVRYLRRYELQSSPSQAMRILDERYAKGEITQGDYMRMKSELAGKSRRYWHAE